MMRTALIGVVTLAWTGQGSYTDVGLRVDVIITTRQMTMTTPVRRITGRVRVVGWQWAPAGRWCGGVGLLGTRTSGGDYW